MGWPFSWRVPAAALVSLGCSALAWHRLSKLGGLAPPPVSSLLAELEAQNPGHAGEGDLERKRLSMIADLNQRLADVSFELRLLSPTYSALTRVCLASGTALTLLGFLDWAQAPVEGALRAFMCALSGLVGAMAVAALGRRAKQVAERTQRAWDRASLELGRSLRTSLTGTGQ